MKALFLAAAMFNFIMTVESFFTGEPIPIVLFVTALVSSVLVVCCHYLLKFLITIWPQ